MYIFIIYWTSTHQFLHPLKNPAWIYYCINGIAFSLPRVMPSGLLVTCKSILDSLNRKKKKSWNRVETLSDPQRLSTSFEMLQWRAVLICTAWLFQGEGPLPTTDSSACAPHDATAGPRQGHLPSQYWKPQSIYFLDSLVSEEKPYSCLF